VLLSAVFVSIDEGIGGGLLVLFIGAVPLVAYWYYKIRPWEDDEEVAAAMLVGIVRTAARRGLALKEDVDRIAAAKESAKARWEAGQKKTSNREGM
jgi:hypothetical protein